MIYQVAHWFDIMRCLYFKLAFSLKKPDEYRKQCQFLENFADFFCSIKINEGSDALPDVQKGVLMTTQSVLHLQEDLIQKEGIEFFMAGRTSGDPVESHHGQERGMIKNPTPRDKYFPLCTYFGMGIVSSKYGIWGKVSVTFRN